MAESKEPTPALALRDRIKAANPNLAASGIGRSISPNIHWSIGREEAFQKSQQFLTEFPHNRAMAIWRSLENLSGQSGKRFYSLIDMTRFRGHEGDLSIREINELPWTDIQGLH